MAPNTQSRISVSAAILNITDAVPDSKVHGTHMGPTWGRQDPGGPHVGPMNLAIWGGSIANDINQQFREYAQICMEVLNPIWLWLSALAYVHM